MMLRRLIFALAVAPLGVHCGARPNSADAAPANDSAFDDVADSAVDDASSDVPLAQPDGDAASSGLPPPVTRSDGVTAANFACNHHFSDAAPESMVPYTFVVSARFGGSRLEPVSGATITLIDPATGLAGSNPSFTSDASGSVSITLAGNSRVAWRASPGDTSSLRCDPCIDGYVFNHLVPPNARATTDIIPTSIIEIDSYFGLTSGLGMGPLVLGTVEDCDGNLVQNAQVHLGDAPVCSAAPGVYPCIAYRSTNGTDVTRTATGATGEFLIVGGTPGPLSITAEGRTSATQTTTSVLGSLDLVTFDRSLSFGATTPLRN